MSLKTRTVARLAAEARHHVEQEILPFWLAEGIDSEHGGFFTCFDNRGRRLTSTDKYTWSQGRFVAVLARAARAVQRGLLSGDADAMLHWAQHGASFLCEHALLADGSVRYVVQRSGATPDDDRSALRSVYADCFLAMGLAELASVSGEARWLDTAELIADHATALVHNGRPPTAPYELPDGTSGYGPLMILLNTRLDLLRAYRTLQLPDRGNASALAQARDGVLSRRRPDGRFDEVRINDPALADTLLARHHTPGHALEGLWMVAEADRLLGGGDLTPLVESADALCRQGWDEKFGGMLRYVDIDGEQPRGRPLGGEYEALVMRTWSTKLWWVHSEAVYSTALLGSLTGDERVIEWRDRLWDYTSRTFPGGSQGREWIQIRDRSGAPLDEVVALPLKDPYHVTRNLLQLLDLADEEKTRVS